MGRRRPRNVGALFKADAVALVRTGGKSVADVVKQFDLSETALREWVKRSEVDAGQGPPGPLTTSERAELLYLRKRLRRAEMERDILKKATARSTGQRSAA